MGLKDADLSGKIPLKEKEKGTFSETESSGKRREIINHGTENTKF